VEAKSRYFEPWHTSAADWNGLAGRRADVARLVGSKYRTWLPRGRRFHHSQWLDTNAIDHAPSRIGRDRLGHVVSRPLPAALSDVLGSRTWFNLVSPFVARLEPVDSRIILSLLGLRFIEYSDELHVPQRRVVVFLHADSVLSDLSPALLGRAPSGTIALFVNRVCHRIFRALHFALRLAAKWLWVLGGFAVCRLPEFALGMSMAMWHTQSGCATRMVSPSCAGFAVGLILYPAALLLYHGATAYVFVDFATGACCFLEIVGIAD